MNEEHFTPIDTVNPQPTPVAPSSGKPIVTAIVAFDILFGIAASYGTYAAMQLQQRMMTQKMASEYGLQASQITFAEGGPSMIGPVIYFALVALLAYYLYKGSPGARMIRILFAGLSAVLQAFALLTGNFFAILAIGYAGFVLWALCGSESVKSYFKKTVAEETQNAAV